jgi:hypothetical protein
MSVSIRKVERNFNETGQTPTVRTDVEYQLGGEIDGVFVPFVTVAAGRVEMFTRQAEADAERAKGGSQAKGGSKAPGD